MTYPSKLDTWLVAVFAGSIVFSVSIVLYTVYQQSGLGPALIAGGATAVVPAFILYLVVWPCRYTLHNDHLHIRCGIIRKDVPYAQIRSLEKSGNPLASPALSLKRVKIDLDKGFVLVSPANRDEFITALKARMAAR